MNEMFALFLRFRLQQPGAEVHILGNFEITVRIEKALFCELALTVGIVPAVVPHGVRTVGVRADVVRNVRNHKLRLWNPIFAVILEIVVINFTASSLRCHPLPPPSCNFHRGRSYVSLCNAADRRSGAASL